MKKSKSMTNEANVYSGDDEGFESSAEKVVTGNGNHSDPTELKTDNDEEEADSSRMTVRSVNSTRTQTVFRSQRSRSC